MGVKTLDNVSFTAMSGEILGIAGIAGSGQKELLEAIAGLYACGGGHHRSMIPTPRTDGTTPRRPRRQWIQ